jgi:hypothetical protein
LAGTVFNSASNAGVAHALVSFSGLAAGFRFTDAAGNFRVEEVPCGSLSISVSKPGFVSARELSPQLHQIFNRTEPGAEDTEAAETSARRLVPDVEAVQVTPQSLPVKIQLVPVSSIGGFVHDENNEPLAGVEVQDIAVRASLDGPEYVPTQTARTDDRGHYSFFDLTPGDYIVRLVGEAPRTSYFMGTLNPNNDHRGLRPTYYPNGDTVSSASVLHLKPGEQATADFRQATEPAFDINGHISGFVAQSWTRIQMYREGDRLPLGRAYVNLSSGSFRVVDAPNGNYILRVVQYQADLHQSVAAEMPVTVKSEPIDNLVVQLSRGVDIPVSVSYEAGAQTGLVSLTLQPQHSPADARYLTIGAPHKRRLPDSEPSEVNPQSDPAPQEATAFTNVVPDIYRLNVQEMGGGGEYVASATLGNMDVLHGEFSISAPGEIHVTLRGDSSSVEGKATSHGQPAAGALIYLIPVTGGRGGHRLGMADENGHYEVVGAPPGDYHIQAWIGFPMAKDILSASGETLTLQPSEHRTVTLEASPGGDSPDQAEGPRL